MRPDHLDSLFGRLEKVYPVSLLRDVLLLADLHGAPAAIDGPQNADLFLGRVAFSFHGSGSFVLGPD